MLITDDHPVSGFMDQFYINLRSKSLTTAVNMKSIFQTHTQIWTNESYRKLAIGILVRIGTNMLLQGVDMSWPVCTAVSVVVLEHYNETKDGIDSVMNKRVVRSKGRDIWSSSTSIKRDLLKFFRKRTSCKCLKKMHLEARRTMPKMGRCMNCCKEHERVHFSVCSRCMIEQYCSRECQVAHWSVHERSCDIYVREYSECEEEMQQDDKLGIAWAKKL